MRKKMLITLVVGGAALALLASGLTLLQRGRTVTRRAPAPEPAGTATPVLSSPTPSPSPQTHPVSTPSPHPPARPGLRPRPSRLGEASPSTAETAPPAPLPVAPSESSRWAKLAAADALAAPIGGVASRRTEEALAPPSGLDREGYAHIQENPFLSAAANPLSTFSIDVDTASYANVRRFINGGQLPPKDAVRIEELVNYFRYDYPAPESDAPFSITTEVGRCPWAPDHRLVLIGLRGRSLDDEDLPPRNLTFLLDVSGSMNSGDKLPLLKQAMGVLVDSLRAQDRVAIVVYAGSSGLVLPSTSGAEKGAIEAALRSLRAGGSTAGGAGIELAYRVAADNFVEGGINRVILATDGDFNVGVSSEGDLVRLIEEKRQSGVFLSVLGFGRGNLQDSKMEKLADHGNGNYSYIDSYREARKVLGSEAGATLVTIAQDVKIQVELNPGRVHAYRLLGYENRALRAEDFADDRKDAGEIGAGHTVTALYEVVPVGVPIDLPRVDPLKYQRPATPSPAEASSAEMLTVKLRHKEPGGTRSRLTSVAVSTVEPEPEASPDLRFSAAVAAFGMLLRDSEYKGSASWPQVIDLAHGALGPDLEGHRAEFLVLARSAERLTAASQVAIAR